METVKAEASLEAFFACCPEMLFVARADGTLLRTSAALRDALAFEDGAALGGRVHPEDEAPFLAAWARLGQGAESVSIDTRLRDAGGAYRRLTCEARRAAEGDVLCGGFRPAPDAGVALRAKLLDTLADHLPLVVWAIDRQGIFVHHDGKGLEGAGLARGQFLGSNIFEIYAGQEGVEPVRRALRGEETHHANEAHGVHWETWTAPIRGAGGDVELVLGATLDISQAKRAEDDLREQLAQIERQQEIIRALSTPIIEVWDGVITVPMLGVVDSARAADVMDRLLARIAEGGARYAILDLTGVDVVDSAVAAHLLNIVSAIRLLGAEGIVAGIKAEVAQTMVALGMDLSRVVTQRDLRAALVYCLKRPPGRA